MIKFIDLETQKNKIRNEISLAIKNVLDHGQYIFGKEVNLHEVKQSKRRGIVSWDGTNNLGLKMVSGMYFYTLKTKNYITTKKMLLLK